MQEKYLPIGTVVLLKGATKNLMITGYCSATPDDPDTTYDYVGNLFPEGSLAGEDVALFNHDQIGIVAHMGLINDEFKNLNKTIKEAMSTDASVKTNELSPFTPENINLILAEIHKNGDDFKPIAEPTAFNEDVIKKPVFELPSLDGKRKKEDPKEEETEVEEVKEEDSNSVVEESVADGQPVLQLQPIFDNEPTGDTTPAMPNTSGNGGIFGLTRL